MQVAKQYMESGTAKRINYFVFPGLKPPLTDEFIKDFIIKIVSEYYEITYEQLASQSKLREIAVVRQVAIYLIKQKTKYSLINIGKFFGNRDHKTIKYSIDTINDLKFSDDIIANQLNILNSKFLFSLL